MRTTVIPAQITTVEDTIAGNLNFTQIVLLVISLVINTFVYVLVPPSMSFSLPKVMLIAIIFTIFIVLSLRVKGRVVIAWLTILATYTLRPHIYIFSKNTLDARKVILPETSIKESATKSKKTTKEVEKVVRQDFDYPSLIRNTSLNLRFRKKGILVVKNYD